jgi:hypothetical protein
MAAINSAIVATNEALVRRRIGARAQGEKGERREYQHVRQGNNVEKFRVLARRPGPADKRIGCRQDAEHP